MGHHHKVCKDCDRTFFTEQKYSRTCEFCKKENHQRKVERTLFECRQVCLQENR